MVFYSGSGIASVDGREYPIEPESVMLAPAGVRHSIRNTGTTPLRFAFIYSPPLPEHVSRRVYHARARDKLPVNT
jgi:mannose-6-phosphate isomerase-like protein (cupin superfamily)